MNDVQIPDTRIPELTSAEIELFINQYGVSNDFTATDKTLEIVSELDVWPDKMFEVILLLPEEQIPDKIFERLTEIFINDLNYSQMSRFLELCFDTYEFTNNNDYILLKINMTKYEKIRSNMEQMIIDDKFSSRDMIYRYCLFTSIKFIPSLISNNSTDSQAFSVVENTDNIRTESGYNFYLDSLTLTYTAVNRVKKPEINHIVKVYKPAMELSQLGTMEVFFMDTFYTQKENAIKHDKSSLANIVDASRFENQFSLSCMNGRSGYTKITFSDESIRQVRIMFPQEPKDVVYSFNERELRNKLNDSDEGILIVAEPLTVEHEPQS